MADIDHRHPDNHVEQLGKVYGDHHPGHGAEHHQRNKAYQHSGDLGADFVCYYNCVSHLGYLSGHGGGSQPQDYCQENKLQHV